MTGHSHEMAKSAINHAYEEATRAPESAQVYSNVAIAHALLEVAAAIRDLASAERGE